MSRNQKVAPSILSADFARLGEEIRKVEEGGADWIHVDVMDGHFVPNLTLGAPVVKCLRPVTKKILDVHLMIEEPHRYIEDFSRAGADYLTIHVESKSNIKETLLRIRDLGVKPGITLRPATPLTEVEPFLELVDLVLIMTVNPGFGGQSFLFDQVEKITRLRKRFDGLKNPPLIEVDGGVNDKTIDQLQDVDVLVAGSYIFKSENYAEKIQFLKGKK